MRIISFDVGIKNLACCVMEIIENQECKILFWDVLNLTNPTVYPPCCVENCKQSVKHYLHNSDFYYCTKHSKKNNNNHVLVPDNMIMRALKACGQKDLYTMAQTHNFDLEKRMSKKQLLVLLEKYVEDNYLIPIPPPPKASTMDLISVGKQMHSAFEKHLQCFEPYDYVIIENQISPIANRMKTVQGMIAYHFIMRNPLSSIHFISASNKLNTFTDDKIENYSDRKKAAVEITKQLLKKYESFKPYENYLHKNGKKDDLADCFLQLLYFVKAHKLETFNI
jgi:hypothetical protein